MVDTFAEKSILENKHFKTIIISDVHLGTKDSKTNELLDFLKENTAETIILNGDIIDGWSLKKRGKWKKKHTRFFEFLMKAIENNKTKVIYIRGNHDDFLDEVLPIQIGTFSIVKDYIHESNGKKYFVCHGDIFDMFYTKFRWVSYLGDYGYTLLLWINKKYNNYRLRNNLPYKSISKEIKSKVKMAVSYMNDFEKQLVHVAKNKGCDGMICGHIHSPANKYIENIHYLNSGDWIESLSALTEDFEGTWKVHEFSGLVTKNEIIELKQPILNKELVSIEPDLFNYSIV